MRRLQARRSPTACRNVAARGGACRIVEPQRAPRSTVNVAPLLALGVPKAKVKILSGVTSRLKQVAVDGDPRILGETLRKAAAAKPDKA